MKRFLVFLLLLTTLLVSCAPRQAATGPWWQDAVFYEIFVRSFNDTDGDGIGDFNGITEKLDYLQSLGVTAIWLMPINPSPSYHGYDVTDYYAVNPQYGTMDDFKRLLAEAHKRDMRIIIDLVLNHTSSKHPWFQSADADPASPFRDWYRWGDDYVGSYWHGGTHGYYYGFFWREMPDLNYENPEVTDKMREMSLYWLNDVGVDGFRIDAAKHLVEEGLKFESTPANHEWLRGYYAFIKENAENDPYLIGEIYGAGSLVSKIYEDQLDHIFNFEIASGAVNSANGGANSGIRSAITFAVKDNPEGNFATFLTNHDQERVMSTLRGDINKAKMASFLLLVSPGTPFLYYGEEIGMTGKKPDEYIRTPMQWDASPNAGFTSGQPWIAVNGDYAEVNVAAQDGDPESLLNHYRALTTLRRQHPALRAGQSVLVETGSSKVFAMLRHDGGETLLIVANLGNAPISDYKLSLSSDVLKNGTIRLETLFGGADAAPLMVANGAFSDYQPLPELPAYQMLVLKLR